MFETVLEAFLCESIWRSVIPVLSQAGSVSAVVVITIVFITDVIIFILSVFEFKKNYIKVINVFDSINKYVSY